ncbi:glycosyltransferase [Lederbergia panacisoli]|uniref:glycosyltransferase n=1 Tax=Lederbergia panacisoli TaxID=1255251 RepID=UPI00214B5D19|nr:glycosyltransferase [Lederbergia panacisoli]MCR2822010.1 glycosyltransferase [Lederbergia panacisoli]
MPTVSIIVPIYNVETYLERCIDSLINQSLQDIEIILVNDGSKDRCGEICEKYAREEPRIKVIHKQNGGLSSARNSGLGIASGKYIAFIDADDWVERGMFEVLVKNSIKHNSDLVVCNYRSVYSVEKIQNSKACLSLDEGLIEVNKLGISRYILDFFLPFKHAYSVWNKLYKHDLIRLHNIRFEPNQEIFAEDLLFNLYYLCHTKLISTTPEVLVNYFQRPNSLSSFPNTLLYRLTNMVKRFEVYLKSNDAKDIVKLTIPSIFCEQVTTSLDYFFHTNDKYYVENCLRDLTQSKAFKVYSIKTIFNKESSKYLTTKGFRIKGRIYFRFMLIRLILGQYSVILKKLNK